MKIRKLKISVLLSLFLVSYLPLFFIMVFRQIHKYYEYFNWGGFNYVSIRIWFKYFSFVSILAGFSLFGITGMLIFLGNIKRRTESNGEKIKVLDIENKNSETITYLFTYIIPFIFQDLSQLDNVVSIIVLILITYFLYVDSTLIIINPILTIFKYSIYNIEYEDKKEDKLIKKKVSILIKNNFLDEEDIIKFKKIGHKLYFAIDI